MNLTNCKLSSFNLTIALPCLLALLVFVPSACSGDEDTAAGAPASQNGCTSSGAGICSSGSEQTSSGVSCEAPTGSRCFYVSAASGSDSNPGTFEAPWSTFLNFVSYDNDAAKPEAYVELNAGDVVYLLSGTYRGTYQHYGLTKSIYLSHLTATEEAPLTLKAYPGHQPIIEPAARAHGIEFYRSSNVVLEGIEIRNAYGAGVFLEEGSDFEIKNMWIHDTDGEDNNNVAGLYAVRVSDLRAHHNLIHDNYDRTNADTGGAKTENSRNIVLFEGGNIRIDHNNIYQTPPTTAEKTGVCITYKHSGSAGSIFEVDHNTFNNCWHTAIGSGTTGNRFHHNLILNSGPIEFKDFGGITNNSNSIIEYNTIRGGAALSYIPSSEYFPIGNLAFRKNNVVDSGSYDFEHGIITISTYGSDALYDELIGGSKLSINDNCYYNPESSPRWSAFARNGDGYGMRGGEYDFSSWQALGYDTNSKLIDPRLDADNRSQAEECSGYGWQEGQ